MQNKHALLSSTTTLGYFRLQRDFGCAIKLAVQKSRVIRHYTQLNQLFAISIICDEIEKQRKPELYLCVFMGELSIGNESLDTYIELVLVIGNNCCLVLRRRSV